MYDQKTEKPAFKTIKHITLPLLKIKLDEEFYIKITGAIFEGKTIRQSLAVRKQLEAAMFAPVINLRTGEEMEMMFNKGLEDTISEEYPDNAYIGKEFAMTKFAKEKGKDHRFNVIEIEIDALKENIINQEELA